MGYLILFMVAIIGAGFFGVMLIVHGNKHDCYTLSEFVGFLICTAIAILLIAYPIVSYNWLAAERKAKIINTAYGTHYTQADVFFASDVIDQIRQIDRRRIELNGDLFAPKTENRK